MINTFTASIPYLKDQAAGVFSEMREMIGFKNPLDFGSQKGSFADLIGSLVLGKEGKYKILEIPVHFVKQSSSGKENIIDTLFRRCFFTNVYIFIHEMGHALACKTFGQKAKVVVYTNVTSGVAGFASSDQSLYDMISKIWKKEFKVFELTFNVSQAKSIIYAAGPLANATFCSLQMLLTTALCKYNVIPSFIATAIKIIAACHLRGELSYALSSFINLDNGDFGQIAKNDTSHLLLASIALVGVSSLSFIGSTEGELLCFVIFVLLSGLMRVK